jgi:hypothetical protein
MIEPAAFSMMKLTQDAARACRQQPRHLIDAAAGQNGTTVTGRDG